MLSAARRDIQGLRKSVIKAIKSKASRRGYPRRFCVGVLSTRNISVRCGNGGASSRHAKEFRTNKIVQTSRADDNPYCTLFHYSLLLITLSVSETIPQSRLRRASSLYTREPLIIFFIVIILSLPCTFSLFTFTYHLERSEPTPQSRLRRAGFPAGEPMAVLILCFQCEVGL